MSPPPGWYPDPSGQAGLRWWDGVAWTTSTSGAAPFGPPGGGFGAGPPLARGRSAAVVIIAVVAALAVFLVAGGAAVFVALREATSHSAAAPGPGPGAGTGPRAGPSAALRKLVAVDVAANAAGSVLVTGVSAVGGTTVHFREDLAASSGRQEFVAGAARETILVVGQVAYVRGNAAGLHLLQGFPTATAGPLAERWISWRSGQAGYAQVAQDVTLPSQLSGVSPQGAVRVHAVERRRGVRVRPFTGTAPSVYGAGTVTLYAAAGSDLPLLWVLHTRRERTEVVFRGWGSPVHVSAPPAAIPFSSLATGGEPNSSA